MNVQFAISPFFLLSHSSNNCPPIVIEKEVSFKSDRYLLFAPLHFQITFHDAYESVRVLRLIKCDHHHLWVSFLLRCLLLLLHGDMKNHLPRKRDDYSLSGIRQQATVWLCSISSLSRLMYPAHLFVCLMNPEGNEERIEKEEGESTGSRAHTQSQIAS